MSLAFLVEGEIYKISDDEAAWLSAALRGPALGGDDLDGAIAASTVIEHALGSESGDPVVLTSSECRAALGTLEASIETASEELRMLHGALQRKRRLELGLE